MSALRARTGVTPITAEFAESRLIVRKRTANASNDSYCIIVAQFQREEFSGDVVLRMTKGSIRSILAEESAPIDV